jgi:carboxypeptidase Taq
MYFQDKKVKDLLSKTRVLWALGHAMALMSWDAETYMPEKGIAERSVAMGELSVLSQKLLLDESITKLVDDLVGKENLNEYEAGVVRVLERQIRIMKALPPDLVREIAEITQRARPVWREAKEKNKYDLFKPYLDKIIELMRRAADYIGYDEHPYDALLDRFEEGLLTRDVDKMFSQLESGMKKILNKIISDERFPMKHELEKMKYDKDAMENFNLLILEKLGYPKDRGRLDISAHPFTIHMGLDDVRITTRYEGFDFKRTLFSTIHEFGHALYELQIDPNLRMTPIGTGVSLGLHESQSRFWENIIGRSREFVEGIYDHIRRHLEFLNKFTVDDLYKYFNTVRPSFIRTEADEVTYNFHILLRFKIEKMMIAGEISAGDIPELWDDEMERLLGIRPESYSEGLLQDIHWSMGSMGYFPTYTIGTIVATQIKSHIVKDLKNFSSMVHELKFDDIREYLKEKIHKWGSTFAPKELLKRSFGEEMDAKHFLKYLEYKYLT